MSWVIGILAILYPVIAYVGLSYGSPSLVALGLIVILLLRYKFGHSLLLNTTYVRLFIVTVIVVLGYSLITDSSYGIRFYPVVTSLLFLGIFAISLWSEQSIIERIARIREPDLPESAISYTRKVTISWCVFFLINGIIAFYTAVYSDIEIWTLYNGFISYCIMALLTAVEWLVRKKYKYKLPAS
ncbi:hypothetical protein [Paraglaciecola arctica]|uniref:COG4648 family protein n=1 Tax=Paraglaciecola arctica TaxID=1128911 RepID=UPI001C0722A4|nr:hypothetical protein [Paraglaciecola arctica]MBU3003483.1 hypothetical protein [Paraglaciecola arctica]